MLFCYSVSYQRHLIEGSWERLPLLHRSPAVDRPWLGRDSLEANFEIFFLEGKVSFVRLYVSKKQEVFILQTKSLLRDSAVLVSKC